MSYLYGSDVARTFSSCKNGKNICYDKTCYSCVCVHANLAEQKRINDAMEELEMAYQKRKQNQQNLFINKEN